MTRRERLEMVIANTITDELIEDCKVELEKLNASNASRKPSERQIVNGQIAETILGFLTDEPIMVDTIVANLGGDYTRQRVSGILTTLVKDGKVKAFSQKTNIRSRPVDFVNKLTFLKRVDFPLHWWYSIDTETKGEEKCIDIIIMPIGFMELLNQTRQLSLHY